MMQRAAGGTSSSVRRAATPGEKGPSSQVGKRREGGPRRKRVAAPGQRAAVGGAPEGMRFTIEPPAWGRIDAAWAVMGPRVAEKEGRGRGRAKAGNGDLHGVPLVIPCKTVNTRVAGKEVVVIHQVSYPPRKKPGGRKFPNQVCKGKVKSRVKLLGCLLECPARGTSQLNSAASCIDLKGSDAHAGFAIATKARGRTANKGKSFDSEKPKNSDGSGSAACNWMLDAHDSCRTSTDHDCPVPPTISGCEMEVREPPVHPWSDTASKVAMAQMEQQCTAVDTDASDHCNTLYDEDPSYSSAYDPTEELMAQEFERIYFESSVNRDPVEGFLDAGQDVPVHIFEPQAVTANPLSNNPSDNSAEATATVNCDSTSLDLNSESHSMFTFLNKGGTASAEENSSIKPAGVALDRNAMGTCLNINASNIGLCIEEDIFGKGALYNTAVNMEYDDNPEFTDGEYLDLFPDANENKVMTVYEKQPLTKEHEPVMCPVDTFIDRRVPYPESSLLDGNLSDWDKEKAATEEHKCSTQNGLSLQQVQTTNVTEENRDYAISSDIWNSSSRENKSKHNRPVESMYSTLGDQNVHSVAGTTLLVANADVNLSHNSGDVKEKADMSQTGEIRLAMNEFVVGKIPVLNSACLEQAHSDGAFNSERSLTCKNMLNAMATNDIMEHETRALIENKSEVGSDSCSLNGPQHLPGQPLSTAYSGNTERSSVGHYDGSTLVGCEAPTVGFVKDLRCADHDNDSRRVHRPCHMPGVNDDAGQLRHCETGITVPVGVCEIADCSFEGNVESLRCIEEDARINPIPLNVGGNQTEQSERDPLINDQKTGNSIENHFTDESSVDPVRVTAVNIVEKLLRKNLSDKSDETLTRSDDDKFQGFSDGDESVTVMLETGIVMDKGSVVHALNREKTSTEVICRKPASTFNSTIAINVFTEGTDITRAIRGKESLSGSSPCDWPSAAADNEGINISSGASSQDLTTTLRPLDALSEASESMRDRAACEYSQSGGNQAAVITHVKTLKWTEPFDKSPNVDHVSTDNENMTLDEFIGHKSERPKLTGDFQDVSFTSKFKEAMNDMHGSDKEIIVCKLGKTVATKIATLVGSGILASKNGSVNDEDRDQALALYSNTSEAPYDPWSIEKQHMVDSTLRSPLGSVKSDISLPNVNISANPLALMIEPAMKISKPCCEFGVTESKNKQNIADVDCQTTNGIYCVNANGRDRGIKKVQCAADTNQAPVASMEVCVDNCALENTNNFEQFKKDKHLKLRDMRVEINSRRNAKQSKSRTTQNGVKPKLSAVNMTEPVGAITDARDRYPKLVGKDNPKMRYCAKKPFVKNQPSLKVAPKQKRSLNMNTNICFVGNQFREDIRNLSKVKTAKHAKQREKDCQVNIHEATSAQTMIKAQQHYRTLQSKQKSFEESIHSISSNPKNTRTRAEPYNVSLKHYKIPQLIDQQVDSPQTSTEKYSSEKVKRCHSLQPPRENEDNCHSSSVSSPLQVCCKGLVPGTRNVTVSTSLQRAGHKHSHSALVCKNLTVDDFAILPISSTSCKIKYSKSLGRPKESFKDGFRHWEGKQTQLGPNIDQKATEDQTQGKNSTTESENLFQNPHDLRIGKRHSSNADSAPISRCHGHEGSVSASLSQAIEISGSSSTNMCPAPPRVTAAIKNRQGCTNRALEKTCLVEYKEQLDDILILDMGEFDEELFGFENPAEVVTSRRIMEKLDASAGEQHGLERNEWRGNIQPSMSTFMQSSSYLTKHQSTASSPVIDGRGLQQVEENYLGLRQLSMRGAADTCAAVADVRKPPLMTTCGTGRKKNWQSGRFENDNSSPLQTHPPSLVRPVPDQLPAQKSSLALPLLPTTPSPLPPLIHGHIWQSQPPAGPASMAHNTTVPPPRSALRLQPANVLPFPSGFPCGKRRAWLQ